MTDVLWILVGVLIGTIIGIVGTSITDRSTISDLNIEVIDLRTQRRLLRDEIGRLERSGKPVPRKRRKSKNA